MKDLTLFFQEHRKTLQMAGIVVAAAALFNFLLVRPSAHRVRRLEKEVAVLRQRIAQVVPGRGADRPFEEIILERQKELSRLESGFPQKERISEILKNLSQRAAELGVTVLSIRPQISHPYPSAEAPLRVGGRICHALPIQMQVECPYRTVGKYLESLTENFPTVVTVDDLHIQREEGKLPSLSVSLVITSYLFQPD